MIKETNKKIAFTLAEVLITLSIIGVVAALTIPNIIRNIQDTELKTAFKKSYANLVNIYNQINYENGGNPYNCYYGSSIFNTECAEMYERFKEKLKIAKTYSGSIDGINIPKMLTRTEVLDQGGTSGSASCSVTTRTIREIWYLQDGSAIMSAGNNFSQFNAVFVLDTNGLKPPNKWGYDAHVLNFRNKLDSGYKMVLEDQVCFTVEKGGKRIYGMLED